ncbi:MAG: LemA family protein [Candidatus Woesearchaeota archaeon]
MIALYIILGVILAWLIFTYNSFVQLQNYVRKSFSGIDVQLKKRADLVPNLVSTVKSYAKHEATVLEEVTKARSELLSARDDQDVKEMAKKEKNLTQAFKSLFAVAENYPDLKASENFLKLQEELSLIESQIAAARRIYNSNVMQYNTKRETIPSNIVAKIAKFEKHDLFKAEDSEKKNVEMSI